MHTNRPEFKKNFIMKEGCKIGYQWKNANKVYIFENFSWILWTGVSHRMIWTVLKTDSWHVALLTDNFSFIGNPERFSSSLKKTIIPYLVKKFEMFMAIFTSGQRRVFFKKAILYISFTDNPFKTESASKVFPKHKLLYFLYM